MNSRVQLSSLVGGFGSQLPTFGNPHHITLISNIEFEDNMREFKDIFTDYILNSILSFDKHLEITMFTFDFIQKKIDEYINANHLSKNDIIFCLKGGFCMHLFIRNYVNNHKSFDCDFIKLLYKNFKKSDSDFQIIINNKIKSYNIVFQDINDLVYQSLAELKNIFIQNKDYYFEKLEKNKIKFMTELLSLFSKSNSAKNFDYNFYAINLGETKVKINEYDDCNIDKIDVLDDKKEIRKFHKINEYIRYNARPIRNDLLISKDDNHIYLKGLKKNNDYLYVTNNKNIDIISHAKKHSFALHRILFNTTVWYERNEMFGIKNISGELIDISILCDSNDKYELYIDPQNYEMIQLKNNDKRYSYMSLTLEMMIHDLTSMLFVDQTYPWFSPKYQKRIFRMLLLITIDILDRFNVCEKFKTKIILLNILKYVNDESNDEYKHSGIESVDELLMFLLKFKSKDFANYKTELKEFKEYFNTIINEIINYL